jgi:hypothetical protein
MQADRRYSDDLSAVAGSPAERASEAGPDGGRGPARVRRWRAAALCTLGALGGVALFAVLLRISDTVPVTSDAANNVLQAQDLLHGNLLLHGWIIGDATYYTFELPVFALTAAIFGVGSVVPHVASVVVYLLVIASAIALARIGSRGLAAAVRTGIVLAILAIPLVYASGVALLIEKPDHTGTAAITILAFIVIEKWAGRRYTAPLLCLLLVAGQFGDATVLYVTVPAIVLVSGYRLVATRRLRTADGAVLLAAAASVPLEMALHSLTQHAGGFLMVAPNTRLAPASQLAANYHLTVHGLLLTFGALTGPNAHLGAVGAALGFAAMAAAVYGFGRVVVTWTGATRAEQLLCVAIVINIAAYLFSTLPVVNNAREMVFVLPAGAVLAARSLSRGPVVAGRRAWTALAAAAALMLVPLAAAAVQPAAQQYETPLAAWLEAHNLRYGVAAYWNSSAVTVISHGDIMVRSVVSRHGRMAANDWETKWDWYYPSDHAATFAIADPSLPPGTPQGPNVITVADFEQAFGQPVATHQVAGQTIMIYNKNLLDEVTPALPLPTASGHRALHGGHQRAVPTSASQHT